jgi:hypothetical protein
MMLETTNEAAREHWVRPVLRKELTALGLTVQSTIMRFDDTVTVQSCGCFTDKGGHTGDHSSFTPRN